MLRRLSVLLPALLLGACATADPAVVARAVEATLTAAITPTPIVVVITAVGGSAPALPSVTPDESVRATLAAATQTLAVTPAAPGDATALPAPSETPEATRTLTPTLPAIAAGTPPVPVGRLAFEDDFSQPQLWTASEDSQQRIGVADGRMSISLKVSDRFTLVYTLRRRAADFYASVTAQADACRFRDRLGLLFRVQDGAGYYQFEVDCDGRYRLAEVAGGTLTPLQDWVAHPAVNRGQGAVNELGVRAVGMEIEIFANGQPLTRVSDAAYSEGGFGLYAGSGLSENYTATFDDLRVWEVSR